MTMRVAFTGHLALAVCAAVVVSVVAGCSEAPQVASANSAQPQASPRKQRQDGPRKQPQEGPRNQSGASPRKTRARINIPPVQLEFDLPAEFFTKGSKGNEAVTGFRVGIFRPDEADPLRTMNLPRSAVAVNGQTGRLSVPATVVAASAERVVLRVQTVTAATSSVWSDASPAVPIAPPTAAQEQPRGDKTDKAPNAGGRRRVQIADVEQRPRLLETLRKTLSKGTEPASVLAPFRSIEDLATAAVLCRDHGIALDKLSQAMVGPPGQSLRAAVAQLKPSLAGGRTIRSARADAKQLLAPVAQR